MNLFDNNLNMNLTTGKSLLLLVVLPLLLVFVLEPFYRHPLFQLTLEDVPRMQTKKRLFGFFTAITFLGEAHIPLFAMFVIVFNTTHKLSALYIIASFGFICYLNTQLKSVYQEPRPFWVSEDIKPQQCRTDYGSPSGHCMTSGFFWITMYLHKYYEVGAKREKVSVFCTAYIIKMALTVGLILFILFLALSRVFLGEHSYNQVLFGSSLGIVLAFGLHFTVKPLIKKMPQLLRETSALLPLVAILTLGLVMPLCLAFGLYQLLGVSETHPASQDLRLQVFCTSGDSDPHALSITRDTNALAKTGVVGFLLGALLGQLFEIKVLGSSLNLHYYQWTQSSKGKMGIRFLISGIIFGICEVPYLVISTHVPIEQVYYLWLVKYLLPCFLSSFVMFAFARLIFYKLNLVNDQAIGRMYEQYDDDEETQMGSSNMVGPGGNNRSGSKNSLEFMEIEMTHKI